MRTRLAAAATTLAATLGGQPAPAAAALITLRPGDRIDTPTVCTIAYTYTGANDHTYAITTMKGGKTFSNGTSTVSADGKTRTVATEGTNADGKKFKSKAVYDKA